MGFVTIFFPNFCLTVPKKLVGQLFWFSEKIGNRKNLRILRGLHYYLLIFFRSTVPKKFVRKYFGVSERFRFRKFFMLREEGMYHNFLSKFFSHNTEKCRRGTLLCFRKIRVSKNLIDKRRVVFITIFCQSLCLTVPKNFVGEPSFVSENFGNFYGKEKKECITIF